MSGVHGCASSTSIHVTVVTLSLRPSNRRPHYTYKKSISISKTSGNVTIQGTNSFPGLRQRYYLLWNKFILDTMRKIHILLLLLSARLGYARLNVNAFAASNYSFTYFQQQNGNVSKSNILALYEQWMCTAFKMKFPAGSLTCTCALLQQAGFFGYECEYLEPKCRNELEGRFCSRPFYRVSLMWELVQPNVGSSSLICAFNNTLTSVRGSAGFQDLCVAAFMCPLDDTRICSCTADYGGNSCESCEPCKSGDGVQVRCGAISTDCVDADFPTRAFTLSQFVQGLFVPFFHY